MIGDTPTSGEVWSFIGGMLTVAAFWFLAKVTRN
jgi:hypothetical protein